MHLRSAMCIVLVLFREIQDTRDVSSLLWFQHGGGTGLLTGQRLGFLIILRRSHFVVDKDLTGFLWCEPHSGL